MSRAKCLYLDCLEIVGRGVLQAFRVAWREADFYAGCQSHNDPVAAGIVMGALGARAAQPGLPA